MNASQSFIFSIREQTRNNETLPVERMGSAFLHSVLIELQAEAREAEE